MQGIEGCGTMDKNVKTRGSQSGPGEKGNQNGRF